jgi:serine/threonine-protein kinase
MSSQDDGARTLGAYQLVSQLAVGGMAEIYVARTRGLGGFEKLVALKVIHPNFSADPEFVRMLVDEAKLAVQLQHANIVQTFDLGRVDDQYYIAMELIDGVDLYKLLRRAADHQADFPFDVAAFICAEACAGLDYAHRKRDSKGRPLEIVHRDVSPQNVLVSFDGEVKIVDFGIAKAAMRSQRTAAGVIKGKYYYMSPEQAWGDPMDARSDIFSAGILLYEMLVGQMMYMEDDLDKLLEVVRKANIPLPSQKRKGVPPALEAVVMRALKKRPGDRWPSAGELAQALTQFLHGFVPDFNRGRLAAFVREVMGDDPTAQRRDPRAATSAVPPGGSVPPRDEHSLLFKLTDLKPEADNPPLRTTPPSAVPRRADVATHVRAAPPDDFEEADATIVDPGPPGQRAQSTMPSGQFDLGPDDPAVDHPPAATTPSLAPNDDDDDDMPTGTRRLPNLDLDIVSDEPAPGKSAPPPLPGVREAKPTPLAIRTRVGPRPVPPPTPRTPAPAPLSPDPTKRTPPLGATSFADADPADPTRSARARPPSSQIAVAPATVVTAADKQAVPQGLISKQETRPMPKSSFDEPTRIPPAQPPPLESGRFDPALDATGATLSPTGEPKKQLGRARPRLWQLLAAMVAAALGVVAVVAWLTLGGGSDGRGTLSIVSLPTGAEVRVDGNGVSTVTPLTLGDVDPRQTHHVRVSKSGYDVWESDVKFPPSEREVRVQAVLVPTVGTVEIASTPAGAEAIVNGRVRGMTPTTVGDLPPNEDVVIELRLRGYKAAARTVTFAGKRTLTVSIPLEKAK